VIAYLLNTASNIYSLGYQKETLNKSYFMITIKGIRRES